MYGKKFTSFCQVLKKDAHKRKLVPFFLPHGVVLGESRVCDGETFVKQVGSVEGNGVEDLWIRRSFCLRNFEQ